MSLDEALSRMIISVSGWRGVFAESGNEEDRAKDISHEHRIIASLAAHLFSEHLKTAVPDKNTVLVGRDTRPTGEAVADAIIRSLLASGREVRYTGIISAPEIMAFARSGDKNIAGFIYISASHNPIGHNGIKFGLTDGGVLQAVESAKVISALRSFMEAQDSAENTEALLIAADDPKIISACKDVYAASDNWKKSALEAYRDFTTEIISGFSDKNRQEDFFAFLRNGLEKYPLGIAADFNGSARTVSIDREFLTSLGCRFYGLNEKPGDIVHRIVPEGESLDTCRNYMEELHQKDSSVILGYMPDCDGDRGNLVIRDETEKRARSLEAQEVFALACVAELSYLVWSGELQYDNKGITGRAAIAVNDPTSLRVDKIAGYFGVKVVRAEVGEANTVGIARKFREEGYLVRLLGEGSSGGIIIHPSAVRDPIDTLGSIIKLLAIREGKGKDKRGLFEIWCSFSNQMEIFRKDFTLNDIIASLPAFASTGAYTDDALLKVKTADHGKLKESYQKIFLREWQEKRDTLARQYGILSWEAISYNGMTEKRGINRFGEAGRGGLKIEFFGKQDDNSGTALACIWMRGSGTEPVFRIMADAEGPDPGPGRLLERFLIDWQRRMVLEADIQ